MQKQKDGFYAATRIRHYILMKNILSSFNMCSGLVLIIFSAFYWPVSLPGDLVSAMILIFSIFFTLSMGFGMIISGISLLRNLTKNVYFSELFAVFSSLGLLVVTMLFNRGEEINDLLISVIIYGGVVSVNLLLFFLSMKIAKLSSL